MRFTSRVAGILAALPVLAACGGTQPGAPAERAAASVRPPSTTPTLERTTLREKRPCALLDPAERSTAGLTEVGTAESIGGARACDYTAPGTFGVTITIEEDTGMPPGEAGGAARIDVGEHRAVRLADPAADDGTCAVVLAVAVSASVYVDVSNATFRDTHLACERAETVARLIEPDLPGQALP